MHCKRMDANHEEHERGEGHEKRMVFVVFATFVLSWLIVLRTTAMGRDQKPATNAIRIARGEPGEIFVLLSAFT